MKLFPAVLLALFAPLALAFALVVVPADEARAHDTDGNPSIGYHSSSLPLHSATSNGDLAAVNHFLTVHMADVDARIVPGYTPLHWAASGGHATIAAALIAAGAEVNAANNPAGDTPLHRAVRYDHASVVSLLLAAEADVNATNGVGNTPLHRAASRCNPAIVRTLIAAGADVNAKANPSRYGATPLNGAVGSYPPCPDVVAVLIDSGAKVCSGQGCSFNAWSPLFRLANNHPTIAAVITVAQLFIQRGDDVNGGGYSTPLDLAWGRAVIPPHGHGWFGLVDFLIENGGHYGTECAGVVNPRRSYPDGEKCLCPAGTHIEVNGECEAVAVCDSPAVVDAAANRCDCPAPNVGMNAAVAPGDCAAPSAESCGGLTPPLFYSATLSACAPYSECHAAGDCELSADICDRGFPRLLPLFHDATAGECVPFKSCVSGATLNRDANLCECAGAAVLDQAGTGCLCESPNLGTPDACAAPSESVCAGLNPPEFFDTALVSITAGECVSYKPCAGGTLDRQTNTCECPAPAVPDGAGNNCECHAPNLDFAVGDCRAPSVENCAEYYTSPRFHFPRFYSPTLSACASHDECIAVGDCTHAPVAHGLGESDWAAAIMANSYEVVSHLIADHGRNPEDLDLSHTRRPPLHHAALWESDQAALALIEGGADVNRVYGEVHHGETPLHRAAQTGSAAVAKVLLSRGANLDAADYTGDTPLHEAVRRSDAAENVALVSLLLDKGADPNIRGYRGWRPLDVAFHGGDARAWGFRGTWQARRKMMAALIAWGGTWSDECSGGAIPNENYRGEAQVATYPECKCPPHLSERGGGGECVCPAHSHSQVNELCLPKDSAQVELEIEKMRAELERLRMELAALNVRLSLAADGPPEMLEEVAKQAEQAARGIARRRNNFLALARPELAGPAPALALSDTEATCRMLDGEVQTHSRSGAKICSGIDHNDTFCIVGSDSAFPCVGFFRHVRRCNDAHNRPALDPWHCAAPCPSGLRARGAKCAAN